MTAKDDCSADENLAAALRDIAVLTERLVNRDYALALQGKEYERRLTDLNHAHALAEEKNREYLPRDTYDKSEELRLLWQRDVDATLAASGSNRALMIASFSAAGTIIGLILWAISIFWSRT